MPVSAPRKPKRVNLMDPLKVIRSGKMADRSDNLMVTKHMAWKHVRSDGMVLNFDEIVPKEGSDAEKGHVNRKTDYYMFRHRSLEHNWSLLRFRTHDDGWVTVMKEAKRDAEREITMRCTVRRTGARTLITGLMQGRWFGSVMTQRSTIGRCAAKSIGVLHTVRWSW